MKARSQPGRKFHRLYWPLFLFGICLFCLPVEAATSIDEGLCEGLAISGQRSSIAPLREYGNPVYVYDFTFVYDCDSDTAILREELSEVRWPDQRPPDSTVLHDSLAGEFEFGVHTFRIYKSSPAESIVVTESMPMSRYLRGDPSSSVHRTVRLDNPKARTMRGLSMLPMFAVGKGYSLLSAGPMLRSGVTTDDSRMYESDAILNGVDGRISFVLPEGESGALSRMAKSMKFETSGRELLFVSVISGDVSTSQAALLHSTVLYYGIESEFYITSIKNAPETFTLLRLMVDRSLSGDERSLGSEGSREVEQILIIDSTYNEKAWMAIRGTGEVTSGMIERVE